MRTILIIDDNPIILRYMGLALAPRQFEVLTAKGPMEALQMISQELPDVILSDVQMPLLNGQDLTRLLRSKPGTTEVPLILMSGDSSKLRDYESLGAQAALEKPIEIERLVELIEELLLPFPTLEQTVQLLGEPEVEAAVTGINGRTLYLRGDLSAFAPDSTPTIRYRSNGKEYEMSGVVLESLGQTLVLQAGKVRGGEKVERRRSLRSDLDLSVRYRAPGDYYRLARTRDFSPAGIRIVGVTPNLQPGMNIELQLVLEPGKVLALSGVVQWIGELESQVEAGVEFLKVDPAAQQQLTLMLFRGKPRAQLDGSAE